MGKVLKSYMISFVKSWVETVGTILFLLMLCAIVLGMLASPLQIQSKVGKINAATTSPDRYLNIRTKSYTDEFILSYFLHHEDYEMNTDASKKLPKVPINEDLFDSRIKHPAAGKDFTAQDIQHIRDSITSFKSTWVKYHTEIDKLKEDDPKMYFSKDFLHYLVDNNYYSVEDMIIDKAFAQYPGAFDVAKEFNLVYDFVSAPNTNTYEFQVADSIKGMGQLYLERGRAPNNTNNTTNTREVVVSSAFFQANKLKLNSTLKTGSNLGLTLKIVGVGEKYDSIVPGAGFSTMTGSDVDTYAYVFTDQKTIYDIWTKINTPYMQYQMIRIHEKTKMTTKQVFVKDDEKSLGILQDWGTVFYSAGKYPAVDSLTMIKIQVIIYAVLGGIVLVLSFVFVNFTLKKELNQSRVRLGIFKAFGYTTAELSWIFALKTFITMFLGILLGYFVSFPVQMYAANQFASSVSVAFDQIYHSPWFLFVLIIVIPIFFTLISYLLTLRDLRESSLELMRNSVRAIRRNVLIRVLSVIFFPLGILSLITRGVNNTLSRRGVGFSWRMRYAFTQRGLGKFVMVIALFVFSSFMFTTQLSARAVMNNVIQQGFAGLKSDLNHSFLWKNHGNFDVDLDDNDQPILQFIKEYNNWNDSDSDEDAYQWNPATDMYYVDYAADGLAATEQKYFDMQTAAKVTTAFDFVAKKQATNTLSENDKITFPLMPGQYNKKAVYELLFMLMSDLGTSDVENSFNELETTVDVTSSATAPITTTIKEYIEQQKDVNKEHYFTLMDILAENNNKAGAIYAKDYTKLLCVLANLQNLNNMPDVSNPNSWTIDLDSNSGSSEGGNGQTGAESPNIATAMMSVALMLDKKPEYNPLIVANTMLYNSKTDLLAYEFKGSKKDGQNIDAPVYRLLKNDIQYGEFKNAFAPGRLSNAQFNKIRVDNGNKTLNAIVSYRFAKGMNLGIGDTADLYLGSKVKLPVTLKIVGIDYNDTFGTNINLDYDLFMKYYFENGTGKYPRVTFNTIYSNTSALNGNLDIKEIAKSIQNMKVDVETMAVALEKNKSLFGSISDIAGLLGGLSALLSGIFTTPTDPQAEYLNNASLTVAGTLFMPYDIIKSTINNISNTATVMMAVFIVLDAVLLLIILVVIMNIVVDEASRIILTMRSIGYKNRQINWMIMGNYVVFAIGGFILSYIFTMILWYIVQVIVWNQFSILIAIPFEATTPLISFVVLATIIVCGWIAAMQRINRHPLTQITD